MAPIRQRIALGVAVTVAMVVLAVPSAPAAPSATSPKIAPRVLAETADGQPATFLVLLGAQADLSGAARLTDKVAKGRFVLDALRTAADRDQAPLKAILDDLGATYRPHFMANMLTVTGDRAAAEAMAARPEVARIEPLVWLKSTVLPSTPAALAAAPEVATAVEWNVSRVRAPRVWRQGNTGQGVVLGNIDTGQQWTHPAIKSQYRGWNGTTADHAYSWYDEIRPANRAPLDQNGHGTHTVGTMIGSDGGANQVGVAPGATWMGCRSMDAAGFGNADTYVGCWEFMLAPWNLDGQNPDPAKAPVAVSNSWYCDIAQEGCVQSTLLQVVSNARAAGIVPVFAAGNSGPGCGTIGAAGPPAQYDQSYTVGATTSARANTLASFSSRGPATFASQTLVKPDIVAPGDGVRSAYPPNTYATLSGTSMAAPHIAGVIALVYTAKPQLIGDVDATEALISSTATHISSSACSSNGTFPNNLYGYGLVNAVAAVR